MSEPWLRATLADAINLGRPAEWRIDQQDIRSVLVQPDCTEVTVAFWDQRGDPGRATIRLADVLGALLNERLMEEQV